MRAGAARKERVSCEFEKGRRREGEKGKRRKGEREKRGKAGSEKERGKGEHALVRVARQTRAMRVRVVVTEARAGRAASREGESRVSLQVQEKDNWEGEKRAHWCESPVRPAPVVLQREGEKERQVVS